MLFNIEKDCEFLHLSMIEHYLPYFTSVADFVYFYKTKKVPRDDIMWYRDFAEEYYRRYQRLIDHEYLSYTKAIMRRTRDDGQKVASQLLDICDVQAYEPWQFLRIISTYVCLNSNEQMSSFINYDAIYACFHSKMSSEDVLFRSCEVIDHANRIILETIGRENGMEQQIKNYLSHTEGSYMSLFKGTIEANITLPKRIEKFWTKFLSEKDQIESAQTLFYDTISGYFPKGKVKVK